MFLWSGEVLKKKEEERKKKGHVRKYGSVWFIKSDYSAKLLIRIFLWKIMRHSLSLSKGTNVVWHLFPLKNKGILKKASSKKKERKKKKFRKDQCCEFLWATLLPQIRGADFHMWHTLPWHMLLHSHLNSLLHRQRNNRNNWLFIIQVMLFT